MATIVVVRLQTLALPLPPTAEDPDEGLNTQKEMLTQSSKKHLAFSVTER